MKKNECPKVVTNPTRYTGGMNPSVKVETNPTKYTGGKNQAECNVPKKK